jgi:PHD/YefM family antitoxin component YafN of YafNO toxin-antitoxin module
MNINLNTDVKPISYIKTNAAAMLDYINEHRNPIVITQNGAARGVFIDVETYQNMVNALALMKLIQASESTLSREEATPHDEVFAKLKGKIFYEDGE